MVVLTVQVFFYIYRKIAMDAQQRYHVNDTTNRGKDTGALFFQLIESNGDEIRGASLF